MQTTKKKHTFAKALGLKNPNDIHKARAVSQMVCHSYFWF